MASATEALNFAFYVIFINLNINMGAVKKNTFFSIRYTLLFG